MYTRSDLALYRISIVDLPFPVKDLDGCGDYNIPFDSKKDFDFFLLIVAAQARLPTELSKRSGHEMMVSGEQ